MRQKYNKQNATPVFTTVILLVAVVLIVLGIWKGQPHDVLIKAVHICLECVGIG